MKLLGYESVASYGEAKGIQNDAVLKRKLTDQEFQHVDKLLHSHSSPGTKVGVIICLRSLKDVADQKRALGLIAPFAGDPEIAVGIRMVIEGYANAGSDAVRLWLQSDDATLRDMASEACKKAREGQWRQQNERHSP